MAAAFLDDSIVLSSNDWLKCFQIRMQGIQEKPFKEQKCCTTSFGADRQKAGSAQKVPTVSGEMRLDAVKVWATPYNVHR